MPMLRTRAAPQDDSHPAAREPVTPPAALSRRHLLRGSAATAMLLAAGQPLASLLRAPSRQPDDAVALGMRGEPRSLDPAFAYDFVANPVVCQITEGLLRLDEFGELTAALAELPAVSEDGRTYTFSLRENVQFHDQSPLTAADVVASYERLRDPALGSPMRWMFDHVATIAATGDLEVTIVLQSAWPLFPYVLATTAGHVLPAAFLARGGEAIDRAPIGTGPFRLGEWAAGDRITLARHDGYWGERPFFAEAAFVFIDDDARRIEQFTEGNLDGLVPDALTPAEYAQLASHPMREIGGHTAVFVAFRCDQAPFDEPEVRQAIAQAVDIDRIFTQSIGATGMCAANTLLPMNVYLPCGNAGLFDPMPFQPDAARETLGRLRPDGLSAVLNVLDEDPWRATGSAIAEAIATHLAGLGVGVAVRLVPYRDYAEMERTGNYEGMLLTTWAADFPDASASLRPLFRSGGPLAGRNLFGYANLAVDALIDRAQGDVVNTPEDPDATAEALSPEARCALLLEAQRRIAADQPYILLGHFRWFMPLQPNVVGHAFSPQWFWDAFLRDLERPGDVDDVFRGNQPAIDPGNTACQLFLREHLDWMRAGVDRTLALSAISVDDAGEIHVLGGTFTCKADDPVAGSAADGVVLAGHGRWYRDPRSQTDWQDSPIGLQMTSSTMPEPHLTLQLVPPANLGPPIPLRLIRCDTGTLVAAGARPDGAGDDGTITLLSFRKREVGEEIPPGPDATEHRPPAAAPCSSEATFLLARAFRWAREAPEGTGVGFTLVSNEAGARVADQATATHPGFHSPMTILSSFLTYEPDAEAGAILDLPKRATLRGEGTRLLSSLEVGPGIDPVETPAPDGPPAATLTPTPGPSLPGGVCAETVVVPMDPTQGPPFAGHPTFERYVFEIVETVLASGPSYEVTLEWQLGPDTVEPAQFQGLRVEDGVLVGMAAPSYEPDWSSSAAPIEYAVSLRRGDIPPATPEPIPTPTATPQPEPTEIIDVD